MNQPTQLIRFDWAMKNLLRDKANFDVLEGFLTALLKQNITIIEILESESNISDAEKKLNRVDILIQNEQKEYVIIEIQNYHVTAYLERILFGVSKVIIDSIKSGEYYHNIKKVISISILYFNLGLGEDYIFHGDTQFKGVHTNEPLIMRRLKTINQDTKKREFRKYQSQDIFPEYYLINVERFTDILESNIDEWIYLFKHAILPPHYKDKNLNQAEKKLNLLKMTPEQRRHYDLYLMSVANEKDELETAHNKGFKKGKEKGKEEGRQEGKEEGRQEGRKFEKEQIALTMLNTGMDIKTISKITHLSMQDIQKLQM